MKIIKKNQPKIIIFTAMKNCCMLHGRVFIMIILSGCGNGRYLSINSNTYKIGVDVCQPLVDSARSKGHEVTYADNLTLPLR